MSMQIILDTIPHRPPFLFIDEIVEITDDALTAKRTIRAEEPQFEGHYPDEPIMPGVLLCEACFQAAAVFIGRKMLDGVVSTEGGVPLLGKINKARFRQVVVPGDAITIEVKFNEKASKFFMMQAVIKNQNGKTCLQIDFVLTESDA